MSQADRSIDKCTSFIHLKLSASCIRKKHQTLFRAFQGLIFSAEILICKNDSLGFSLDCFAQN